MNICGIQKTSFIDFPNKLCTVLFTGGCNFRCSYCHNKSLVDNTSPIIPLEKIYTDLINRRKFVDAVCVSGGEPTLQEDLVPFIKELKKMNFSVKLDTNGSNPNVINFLLENNLIDYIAMDIKSSIDKYSTITNSNVDTNKILKSVQLIKNGNCNYEFRTTICKELTYIEDLIKICGYIKDSKKYVLQNFKDSKEVLIGEGNLTPFNSNEINGIFTTLKKYYTNLEIR
ncbi:MAG: anaerobic ribonucleoside-triphosphate reductase activating protein [Eubacteriaceae bacterium]